MWLQRLLYFIRWGKELAARRRAGGVRAEERSGEADSRNGERGGFDRQVDERRQAARGLRPAGRYRAAAAVVIAAAAIAGSERSFGVRGCRVGLGRCGLRRRLRCHPVAVHRGVLRWCIGDSRRRSICHPHAHAVHTCGRRGMRQRRRSQEWDQHDQRQKSGSPAVHRDSEIPTKRDSRPTRESPES